jgi:hypothetical protein
VSDKTNDETVNELIKLIKLKVRQVEYVDFLPVLQDLIDSKNAYSDVLDKNIMDDITDKAKDDLFATLDLKELVPNIHHTAYCLMILLMC